MTAEVTVEAGARFRQSGSISVNALPDGRAEITPSQMPAEVPFLVTYNTQTAQWNSAVFSSQRLDETYSHVLIVYP